MQGANGAAAAAAAAGAPAGAAAEEQGEPPPTAPDHGERRVDKKLQQLGSMHLVAVSCPELGQLTAIADGLADVQRE